MSPKMILVIAARAHLSISLIDVRNVLSLCITIGTLLNVF